MIRGEHSLTVSNDEKRLHFVIPVLLQVIALTSQARKW